MIKKLLLTFFVLLLVYKVKGQEKERIISFGENEKIQEVTKTKSLISVNIHNKRTNKNTVQVFNNDGLEIFSKNGFESYVKDIVVSEENNLIIIVNNPYKNQLLANKGKDEIRAYNIMTGELVWENYSSAKFYELSPDNSKIMTRGNPLDSSSELEIIDVTSGEKILLSKKFSHLHTEWFDNDRIVIIQNKWITNPEHKREIESINKKLEKINNELTELGLQYNKGIIAKDEYKQRRKGLIKEKYNSSQLESKYQDRFIIKNPITIPDRGTLYLYNIQNDVIELEKTLLLNNGYPFLIKENEDEFKNIYVDENKDIHLLGYSNSELANNHLIYLKINRNGNEIYNIEIDEISSYPYLKEIINLGKRYVLVFSKINGTSIIDSEVGTITKFENSDLKESFEKFITLNRGSQRIIIDSNLLINKVEKTISIREGGEK